MSFGHQALQQAWYRSSAQCECKTKEHGHPARCTRQLIHPKRGEQTPGGWQAKKADEAGPASAENCVLMCWPCYAYGKDTPKPAGEGMTRK